MTSLGLTTNEKVIGLPTHLLKIIGFNLNSKDAASFMATSQKINKVVDTEQYWKYNWINNMGGKYYKINVNYKDRTARKLFNNRLRKEDKMRRLMENEENGWEPLPEDEVNFEELKRLYCADRNQLMEHYNRQFKSVKSKIFKLQREINNISSLKDPRDSIPYFEGEMNKINNNPLNHYKNSVNPACSSTLKMKESSKYNRLIGKCASVGDEGALQKIKRTLEEGLVEDFANNAEDGVCVDEDGNFDLIVIHELWWKFEDVFGKTFVGQWQKVSNIISNIWDRVATNMDTGVQILIPEDV